MPTDFTTVNKLGGILFIPLGLCLFGFDFGNSEPCTPAWRLLQYLFDRYPDPPSQPMNQYSHTLKTDCTRARKGSTAPRHLALVMSKGTPRGQGIEGEAVVDQRGGNTLGAHTEG